MEGGGSALAGVCTSPGGVAGAGGLTGESVLIADGTSSGVARGIACSATGTAGGLTSRGTSTAGTATGGGDGWRGGATAGG